MNAVNDNKRKRKTPPTLYDYFVGSQGQRAPSTEWSLAEAVQTQAIPGLSIIHNFVNSVEHTAILDFLDGQTWRTDLSRRTIHYGGTYCLLPPRGCNAEERKKIESSILTAEPIPTELDWIVDRMVGRRLYREARPGFCIVNEYRGSQGISAHVENFRFGSPVCAVTLGCGDFMRFHELVNRDDGSVRTGRAAKAERTGRRVDVWLPSRSLLVMAGEAREKWQHEICRGKKGRTGEVWRRVSLTFRVEDHKS